MKMTNLALVVSDFNQEITSTMEKNADKTAKSLNVKIVKKIHVPGAFEIPFAANKLFKDKKCCILVFLKNPQKVKPFSINKSGFGSMSSWMAVSNIKNIRL